jgi:hypothetical protein
VFCMECGAELQPRADRCVVCGRPLDGSAVDALRSAAPAGMTFSARPSDLVPRALPTSTAEMTLTTLAAPSIARGDLDAPGFPRDAIGRALLITVLAMLLDLLAPWINELGQHWSPAQAGAPMLFVALALLSAATPLARPSLRKQPLASAMPLVVGAAGFGAAMLLWVVLVIQGTQASSQVIQSTPLGVSQPAYSVAVADFGLYLFLLGSGTLIYCGYRLFLGAARATAAVEQTVAARPSIAAGLAAGTVAARVANEAVVTQRPLMESSTEVQGASPSGAGAPTPTLAPLNGHEHQDANSPSQVSGSRSGARGAGSNGATSTGAIPLPGTSEWNTTPEPPTYVRPAPMAGWRRAGVPRR